MVCAVCNGKGYVVEKGRELPCSECQGRGEFPLLDNFKLPGIDAHERPDTPYQAALGR